MTDQTDQTDQTAEPTPSPTLFMGLPVIGEKGSEEKIIAQLPIEQLYPKIQAVLNDPEVDRFGWHQYTPYFNDGEPCEFAATGFWAKPTTPAGKCSECGMDGDCDCNPEYRYEFPRYASNSPFGNRRYAQGEKGQYVGPDEARYDRLDELRVAIEGGQFDDVLRDQFGNHVRVAVSKHEVEVTDYEHD